MLGPDDIRIFSGERDEQAAVAQFQLVVGLFQPRSWNWVKLL